MSYLRIYHHGLLVGYQDFRLFWTLRSWLFGWMLRVLTNACAWVLLGRVVGSEDKLHYLLIGNAVAVGASAALWASNATTWSRYDGTHPLLVIAPGSLLSAVVGRTSVWLFNGIATSCSSFVFLFAVFGYRVSLLHAVCIAGIVVLVCASTFSFALFMGALLSNHSQLRNVALDLGSVALLAFCGASVPVEFWPSPVQWLVQGLPMTHGLQAIRWLSTHGEHGSITQQVMLELAVGVGWAVVSLSTMTQLFNAGRADGSIELL